MQQLQQDSATCHTARVTMNLLRGEFGEHHVYTDKRASIDALEDNIEAFILEIPAEMLGRVCQNWTKRLDHLEGSRGQHLQHLERTIDSNKDFIHLSEFCELF